MRLSPDTPRFHLATLAAFLAIMYFAFLIALLTQAQTGEDRNSGYYFTYICSAPDGRTRADRVSNIYYTRLDWVKRQKRIRVLLGGYKGCLGDMGAYGSVSQAEQYRAQFYSGLPRFHLPDPLQ